jgi:thiol:disulfide interchange protein
MTFSWGLVLYKTQVWFLSQVIPVTDPSLHKGMALAAFVWIFKGMLSKGPSKSEVLVSEYIGALVAPWAGLGIAWLTHLTLV